MTTLEKLEDLLKKMKEQNSSLEQIVNNRPKFSNHLKLIVCTGKKTAGEFDLRKYNKIII